MKKLLSYKDFIIENQYKIYTKNTAKKSIKGAMLHGVFNATMSGIDKYNNNKRNSGGVDVMRGQLMKGVGTEMKKGAVRGLKKGALAGTGVVGKIGKVAYDKFKRK